MKSLLLMVAKGWGFSLKTVEEAYLMSKTKTIDDVIAICEELSGPRAG